MAKKLLTKKGLSYIEKNIDSEPELRQEMLHNTRRRTVPQIFVEDFHVGGFDELYALDTHNELDKLLELKA